MTRTRRSVAAQIFFTSLFMASLFGCASSESVPGPDGTGAELIQCSSGIRYCYEKAASVCDGRYKILDSSASTSTNGYSTETTHNLLAQCL